MNEVLFNHGFMKIVQLIQKPQLRGAEIFASRLSNNLLDIGHEVKIISLLDGNSQLPFKRDITILKRSLSNRIVDLTGWRKLADEIKSFNPDIVRPPRGDTLKYAVFSKLIFVGKDKIIFRNASTISRF